MSTPFFSIIMPVYNKEEFVSRAIESVLAQDFTSFELIIVVDKSTDLSLEGVLKFNDIRIRVFTRDTPGAGGYAARNLGIQESQANWIAFLDADDIWTQNHLYELHKEIHSSHYSLDMVVMGYKSDKGKGCSLDFGDRVLRQQEVLSLFSQRDFIHTNCFAVNRKNILSCGGFPDGRARQGGDADTWLRLVLEGQYFRINKLITSFYFSLDGGVISSKKNMSGFHPIYETVRSLLNGKKGDIDSNRIQALLKKISNRKNISWMLHKRVARYFKFSDLACIYFEVLGPKDISKILLLLLPRVLLAKML
ncbi:MAG: glycosyltransferase family A protein [Pseudomonadota bacterium]